MKEVLMKIKSSGVLEVDPEINPQLFNLVLDLIKETN